MQNLSYGAIGHDLAMNCFMCWQNVKINQLLKSNLYSNFAQAPICIRPIKISQIELSTRIPIL